LTKSSEIIINFYDNEAANILIDLCENAKKDDPPLIFLWKNVDKFVAAIPNVIGINPPFDIPLNPTLSEFKIGLLNYVRVPTTPEPIQEGAIICTVLEFSQTIANLTRIETNDWFLAVAASAIDTLPIAAVMTPIPRSHSIGNALMSPPGNAAFWG
jgi:hypothetical protein